MNKLEIYKLHYTHLIQEAEKNNLDWKNNKDLVNLLDWLISDLESYVKREQKLFDVENHILWVDYRDYKFKIYLDADRNTLLGDILLNDEIDVIGLESDSLTQLLTELERLVDNQISIEYQSQLAKENIQLQNRIKELEEEKKSESMWTYCGD